jgi:hypothetical protein
LPKTWPKAQRQRYAARFQQQNATKPDQSPRIAARAPEVYLTTYDTVFFSFILRLIQRPVGFGAF